MVRLALRATALAAAILAVAAAEPAGVSGAVTDAGGRALAGVSVQAQSESTGARWRTATDDNGRYSIAPLAPGRYKITVRMEGFHTVSRLGATVEGSGPARVDFVLELVALRETITVTSGADAMDPAAPSSLLMTRESAGATLPANGGDYRVLFDLMPGVVATPAGVGDAGQFTSSGQRPNANGFRVDGVSANTGVGSSILPGAFPGASLPAMTALGSTENLVSNGTAQSIELRTADFSAEFAGRPGAQALVVTRSGASRLHGEFFGHVRDSGWSARDWFANSRALDFPRPYYRRLAAAAGGPLRRDRTFYFASAELSRLSYTGVQLTSVPSLAARRSAPPALQQVLNLYPWPTGPDLGGGEAEGLLLTSESGQLLTASLRIDQSLGSRGSLFLRVAESPSRARESRFNWASGTAGATLGSARGIHDLRFNYSRADLLYSTYGGSAYPYAVLALAGMLPGWVFLPNGAAEYRPPPDTSLSTFPTLAYGTFGISAPGLGQFLSFGGGVAQQNQMELRETFSRPAGRHHWRLGGDYIVLAPSRSPANYAVLGVASSLESILEGKPLAVLSSQPAPSDRIHQLSWFAQDTFRPHERLSLLYGLSWAITPPTTDAARPPSVSGLWTGSEWRGAYTGDIITAARWPMRYAQVAPRVGIAWKLPFEDLVLRAGGGTFQDTTLGAMVSPINGAPFNSWLLAGGGSGLDTATGPSVGLGAGAGDDVTRFLSGVHRPLRLPTSYQWRLALERAMGGRGVASAAWLGAAGRGLLGHQAYVDAETGVLRRNVALTENSSSYQALQVRYSGSATRSLYGSVSYSWSHSIDDGSQDSSVFLVHPGYRLSEARASSSFDVRHALTAAWSYRAPRLGPSSRLPVWLGGWTWSGMARVRSGFPIDVFLHAQPLGRGFDNAGRPDRVAGAPLWIDDAQVAGRRRLNQAAFRAPAGAAGTLGRNAIAGNGLMQVDMSLRREFRLVGGLSAEVGVNVFNVLNHPAFADPTPYLSSPWFGQSTSMQNLMFGSGSPNTGLPPLFQPGGARSAELSFRASF